MTHLRRICLTVFCFWHNYPQMSCHPELNQYIQDTLHCVKPLIEKVRQAWLVFFSATALMVYHVYVIEWCREGGRGHHGQRASSGREICVWDLPTSSALNQVCSLFLDQQYPKRSYLLSKSLQLYLWSLTGVIDWHSSDTLLSHVEQLLRAFILKISVCDAVLNNNPPGERSYHCKLLNGKHK